ncbi:MAG: MGMT family protein [Erysipelotrichaceae bacterium]|nr:MGMT family protein [Erysipelotrichaceae bacterium]
MIYTYRYKTPKQFDDLKLVSDGEYLIEVSFISHEEKIMNNDEKYFADTIRWLDLYFDHQIPDFIPKYRINDLTPFREKVIKIMEKIPYGKTITYGQIGEMIAKEKGIPKMSAQAVGGAVGFNPICIIVPCHRVMGAGNKITGYGGGIKNKVALLELEGNLLFIWF